MRAVLNDKDVVEYYKREGYVVDCWTDERYYLLFWDLLTKESPFYGLQRIDEKGGDVYLAISRKLDYQIGGGFIDQARMLPFFLSDVCMSICLDELSEDDMLMNAQGTDWGRKYARINPLRTEMLLGRYEVIPKTSVDGATEDIAIFMVDYEHCTHCLLKNDWDKRLHRWNDGLLAAGFGGELDDMEVLWRLTDGREMYGVDFAIGALGEDDAEMMQELCDLQRRHKSWLIEVSEEEWRRTHGEIGSQSALVAEAMLRSVDRQYWSLRL